MDLVNTAQRFFNLWSPQLEPPKWVAEFYSQWLPQLVVFLLVILVAQQAAHLTWRIVPDPPAQKITIQKASVLENTPNIEQTLRETAKGIADLHLFGRAGVSKTATMKQLDTKAPETNLKLTLYGVFAEAQPETGAAIVGKAGSTQKYYKVGGEIMSGVKLQAVYHDRVVLLRSGKPEVLKFPKTVKRMGANQKMLPVAQTSSNSLKKYRDQFKDEPLKIFQHVRFVPVRSGKTLKGYRVLPQKNRELYNKLGIRPSDLVTAVNGISLSNDKEAVKLINQLKEADQINLEIVRRGKPESLAISLN